MPETSKEAVYIRKALREKAERKGRMRHFERLENADIDSKTGSVIIAAYIQFG